MTHPQKGIFGIDLFPGIDIQDFLPKPVTDAIQGTVDRILDPASDVEVGSPQPPDRPIPVDAGSKELSDTVRLIDSLIGALELVLKAKFLIPDGPEKVIGGLIGALRTIRSWLD